MIMKENKLYTSIFNAADFDRILSSAVCRKQIAEAGYERMKESGTLCLLRIETQLRSHHSTEVRGLASMLQEVLAI